MADVRHNFTGRRSAKGLGEAYVKAAGYSAKSRPAANLRSWKAVLAAEADTVDDA